MTDGVELRKKYFNFVRDIPYKIYLTSGEPDYCCTGKHFILRKLLESLGLKVRYRVCEFSWKENFDFPVEVKSKEHDDICTHTYLEVLIPETKKWDLVDATNDIDLKRLFKVNEWDGITDTQLWCKTIKTYSPEESEKFVNYDMSEGAMEEDLKKHGEFYKAINNWLNEIRRGN